MKGAKIIARQHVNDIITFEFPRKRLAASSLTDFACNFSKPNCMRVERLYEAIALVNFLYYE